MVNGKTNEERDPWRREAMRECEMNALKIMLHDIRGSLVSMSATLKLLTRGYYGKIDEGVTNHLNELLSKTISLNGMTEEYLSRAFSVDGDLEVEDEALDLKQDILDPILEELHPELRAHCIRVEHPFDEMSTRRIPVKANRFWWKTIFRNLLKNAIKYGNPGSTIAIGFENQGSFYRLNVYNSGKPIPEEYRSKIFTKFMSFGKNGNGGSDGMGLGLYLVKEIIRKHGGDIWYQAEEGGSNFVFTLPRGSAFSTDLFLPIKPVQLRLTTVRLQKMKKEELDQKAY
jgi:signal transduction histidine kinase